MKRLQVIRSGRAAGKLRLPLFVLLMLIIQGCLPPFLPPTRNTDLTVCTLDPACTDKLSVGHRGTYLWGPENTIASFFLAYRMGADFVEMDVRETADGHMVLMHDDTVNRTTNGSGRVDGMTLDEIKELLVISPNPDVPHQEVPTFEEALLFCQGKLCVDVDPKCGNVERIAEIVEECGMLDGAMILTKSIDSGLRMRAAVPDITLLGRCGTYEEVVEYMDVLDPPVYEVDWGIMWQVEELIHSSDANMFVDALGTFDLLGGRGYDILVEAGVDIIQTDLLPLLVPYLRDLNDRHPSGIIDPVN